MRINVSAEAGFFAHPAYPVFKKLLAAVAAGITAATAEPDTVIDVQINSVVMASVIDQFVFTAGSSGSFSKAPRGPSTVTMEICHVNNIDMVNGNLLSAAAVSLVYSCFEDQNNVNCWLRRHGRPFRTGWGDKEHSLHESRMVRDSVSAFINGHMNGALLKNKLSKLLK